MRVARGRRRAVLGLLVLLGACSAAPPPWAQELDRSVPAILARDRIPSAVVAAGDLDGTTYRRAFGDATPETVYDLASCTKVVATTTAAMLLVEEGKIALEDRVSRHLPEFEGRDITIEELLAHRSGLPAYLIPKGKGSDAVLDEVAALKASKTFRYS
jgi:CubicO group peptidase (beta-lactamase class C family)